MFQQGLNQTFNNGMMNTALYNDPALLQLYFANLFQGNHGLMSSMYPYGCGYAPYVPGAPTAVTGVSNGVPVLEGASAPQLLFKDSLEAIKTLESSTTISPKSNDSSKSVKTNGSDNLGSTTLSTPERTKQEVGASTYKMTITTEGIEDAFLKKRRKECSIDSVNSIVETVATETNSNVDECSAGKKSRDEVETRSFEISQEGTEAVNTGEGDDIPENQTEGVYNSSMGGAPVSATPQEDEIFLSNDRKTSLEKIMRIHSSLIGSLSWTAPINKDDVILKSLKENSETSNGDAPPANRTRTADKGDEAIKPLQQCGQDEYNPFVQREYNSSNVTCFSPRMLPDWQLNWLRDVTRSLSSVPKSPMTGIHFDRTKPAWAVSYYECETRKYYFFFIPDLSEYTIEITLAAAIGCRQNVVARGAHKRKKPGVLTFNLYSGQFEKSTPETPTASESGADNTGICNQRFKKPTIPGTNNGANNGGNPQLNGPANLASAGTHPTLANNSVGSEFPRNVLQTLPGNHTSAMLPPNKNHLNLLDPSSMPTLNNFHIPGQVHAHPHMGPAQMLFPHMTISGQNSVHAGLMASLMHGAPHMLMMDALQQNALRNASLLYAAALSSSNTMGIGGGNISQASIHNSAPHSTAVPANISSTIGMGATHTIHNIEKHFAGDNLTITPSPATAASTVPATPTKLASGTTSLEVTTNPPVISVPNNGIASASPGGAGNIAFMTATNSACIPAASSEMPPLPSMSENAGKTGIMLNRTALDELAQTEKKKFASS